MAGKITKIRTRKNFVPHGISSLSELCLFCWQLVSFLEEKNLKKKIIPICRRKASVHLKFSLIVCNKIVAVWCQEWAPDGAFYPGGYST